MESEISQPPLALLDFFPLGHVCNSVLASLNAIRLCAPLSLAGFVAASITGMLAECAARLAAHFTLNQSPWGDTQRRGYLQLCHAFKRLLLPYLAKCLVAVFPPRDLAAVSGLAITDLQARGLGFLDTGAILAPLADLLRPFEEEEEAAMASMGPNAAGDTMPLVGELASRGEKTEYVADKMADLVAAVDGCEHPANPEKNGGSENVEPVAIHLGEIEVEALEREVDALVIAEQQQDEQQSADPIPEQPVDMKEQTEKLLELSEN